MSFYDGLAEDALRAGNNPEQFRAAAKRHANAFWLLAVLGVAVWYFAGWGWSLIPFLFGALQVFLGVSSTLTARKLQPLMPHKGTASLVRALSPEIDLDDVLQVTTIDDIRQKYGALLEDQSQEYSQCIYRPSSLLPYPKAVIRRALQAMLDFVEGRRNSRYLDAEIRTPQVADTIRTCLAQLDDFLDVPTTQLPSNPRENARVGLSLPQNQRKVEGMDQPRTSSVTRPPDLARPVRARQSAPDAGMRVVEEIRRVLKPDEAWTQELERGFEFWPGPSPMRITSGAMRKAQGLKTFRVCVSSEVLAFTGSIHASAREYVSSTCSQATLSGWQVEASNGRASLVLSASVGVHNDTVPVLARLLADAAVLQLKEVYDLRATLRSIADLTEWIQPALDGVRSLAGRTPAALDEMCAAADQVLIPMGRDMQQSGRLSTPSVARELRRLYGLEVLEEDDLSMSFIVTAHGKRLLAQLSAATSHPELGMGYLMLLHTGEPVDGDGEFDLVTSANRDEATALLPFHGIGSWCRNRGGKLTHVTFLPVGAAMDVHPVVHLAAAAQFRAMWAVQSGLVRF